MIRRSLVFPVFLFVFGVGGVYAQDKLSGLSAYPADIPVPVGAGSKNPKAVEAYKEGRRAVMGGNRAVALIAFDKAIKLDEKFAAAYNQKAVVLMDDGRGAEAIADFTEALKINPVYYEARFNRAFGYWLYTKEYPKAIDDLTKCIAENPENGFLYSSRAKVYELLNKPELAAADREKARSLRKNSRKQ